jgi:hypothetical protein
MIDGGNDRFWLWVMRVLGTCATLVAVALTIRMVLIIALSPLPKR